ncbi:4182_t:CDS:1, partial [Ambispora gerdemannii]
DIWDTVHGYPLKEELDIVALIRFTKEQFNINIIPGLIIQLFIDELGN